MEIAAKVPSQHDDGAEDEEEADDDKADDDGCHQGVFVGISCIGREGDGPVNVGAA